MSVFFTPPGSREFSALPSSAQWHAPIEPDTSTAKTWATRERRWSSSTSLVTGRSSSSGEPR